MLIRMINSMFVEITEALEHLVHSFGILPVKAEWEPTIKQAKELIRNKFQVFFMVTKVEQMLVTIRCYLRFVTNAQLGMLVYNRHQQNV